MTADNSSSTAHEPQSVDVDEMDRPQLAAVPEPEVSIAGQYFRSRDGEVIHWSPCVHEGVPAEQAGWYAQVRYKGMRVTVEDHRSPEDAARALAEQLLFGGTCRCGKTVVLDPGAVNESRCCWQLIGRTWTPGCNVPSVFVDAKSGDYAAMQRVFRGRADS